MNKLAKQLLSDKEIMGDIQKIVENELKKNMKITETSYICMYGKGKTSVFGHELTFKVYFDKWNWKWNISVKHLKYGYKISEKGYKTQIEAANNGIKNMIQLLTEKNKLQTKEFTQGIMKQLSKKGWTLQKIFKKLQENKKKSRL